MLKVEAKIQDQPDGQPLLHVCVFENAEMARQSSPDACGTFRYRHEAEQVARLLKGLGHGAAALHVRGLVTQLPEN